MAHWWLCKTSYIGMEPQMYDCLKHACLGAGALLAWPHDGEHLEEYKRTDGKSGEIHVTVTSDPCIEGNCASHNHHS